MHRCVKLSMLNNSVPNVNLKLYHIITNKVLKLVITSSYCTSISFDENFV